MIEVLSPGFYTTIQDKGRTGFRSLGIPQSGAMDIQAFELANALLPNKKNQTVFECTFIGPKLLLKSAVKFIIVGAEIDAHLDDSPVFMNQVYHANKGAILELGKVIKGVRSYIRFAAIVSIDNPFDSVSFFFPITKNSVIQRKDRFEIEPFLTSGKPNAHLRVNTSYLDEKYLEVKEGPDWNVLPKQKQKLILKETHKIISQNRMGYRLDSSVEFEATNLASQIVIPGIVQLSPGGTILVATADCQVTGGYLQILMLNKESLSCLVQKREGEEVQFKLK